MTGINRFNSYRRSFAILGKFRLALAAAALLVGSSFALGQGEPEEPDYFFVTGGPYTQKKNSPQIIWANQFFWSDGPGFEARDYSGGGRFEWGLTDRWEIDFEFGGLHTRQRIDGAAPVSESDIADFLVGVRYRLLDESFAPFTLTLGPQVIIPAASRQKGFGTGEPAYAVDITAAKDWGGPAFLAASINLGWAPNIPLLDGSGREEDLTEIGWAIALGLRPLERTTAKGTSHDIHLFLEFAGERGEELGDPGGPRTGWLFSPGIRYGFVSSGGSLTEIGTAFPVGLNAEAPDWGWILQFQFELPSVR